MRSLLLVESFDLRPSNQYILVRAIPSCFRLCQVSLLSSCSSRYLRSSCLGSCLYGPGACSECDVDPLGSISFYAPFLKPVLDCSEVYLQFL
jgi:hypothetical protein